MTALDDFHPDLAPLAAQLPQHIIDASTLPQIREATEQLKGETSSDDVETTQLPSGASMRVLRGQGCTASRAPGLLWLHGGGYVMGTARQDETLCRRFADELGITVGAVDYRLAPEHPYPASLDDCDAALSALAGLDGVDSTRIAVGGASAGAGVAAAWAIRLRDRGTGGLCFQLLTYPMLDDRSTQRAHANADNFRLWDKASNEFGWSAYLGDADPAQAVPARQADLSGLPAAWIAVGTLDLFHDEAVAYGDRLRASGVPCKVSILPGAFHGFDSVAPEAGISQEFFAMQRDALRAAFSHFKEGS
ncbi:alpha/beta hydrolase [Mycobacterium sp. DL440]|uniref:alpha/beta hydrolase n=1 Tax=Mycobacterium sp. DL440 TaxID=2675523 RepID=UPI001421A1EA|nr:alpha/beta hydrolase [Mycobacterium sp. DL440]